MVGRRNELHYRITGDSRGFNQAVDQADAAIGRFDQAVAGSVGRIERQFGRLNSAVAGVAGGLAALGVVGAARGLADFARQSFESAEQIDRLSRSLGVSAEAVQELDFAFRQFGLERDDVADALGTIAERAQDALDGSSAAAEGFRRVGLSLDDLRGRAPDELFRQFAEAVSEIDDPTRRTAAIIGTLGDDLGRQLAPALVDGAEGFDELARKAREAGLILSDDAVAASTALNESLRELSDRTLGAVSNAFANATVSAARFFGLLEGSGVVAEFGGVQGAVEALQRQQDIVADLSERLASGTVQGRNRRGAEAALEAATEEAQRISAAITKFQDAVDKAASRTAPTFDPPAGGGGGGAPSRPAIADVDLEPLRRMDALLGDIDDGNKRVADSFEGIDRAADQLGFTFTSAFENAVLEGESLRGVLQGIADDIARIVLRQTVTRPLAGALSSGISDIASSFFGGGFSASPGFGTDFTGGTVAFADGGVASGFRGLSAASGSIVDTPTFFPSTTTSRLHKFAYGGALAGEAGPEAILPLQRGSNGKLGVVAEGGGGVEIHLHNEGAPLEVTNQRQTVRPDGRRVIEAEVRQAMRGALNSGGLDREMAANFGVRRQGSR